MAKLTNSSTASNAPAAAGYETELWRIADTFRGSIDEVIPSILTHFGYSLKEERA